MTVLLLRLAGPLQSWGSTSRFSRRTTDAQPTKSGVVGLLAAAQGRRRTDEIEDLLRLSFGVRLDQPGTLQRDFQTARSLDGREAMPLSYRFYLADAAFLAAVGGDAELLTALDQALRRPTFPLYLGRRSCPPTGPVTLGLRDGTVREALSAEPWQASRGHQRRTLGATVQLEMVLDATDGDPWVESYHDAPVSFDPRRRLYAERGVVRDAAEVVNPFRASSPVQPTSDVTAPVVDPSDEHDPFAALGGA